jgi:hypothetical protein
VKLYRPHIPLSVRILVATRQCYVAGFNPPARNEGESLASLLTRQLAALAIIWHCHVPDLRLDHHPALALRERRGEGKKTIYKPTANDPGHLFYRPHGAQFEGSHDVKTRIRGDNGQYSDLTLIKRERRRAKKKAGKSKPKRKWGSRPFRSASRWPKRLKK